MTSTTSFQEAYQEWRDKTEALMKRFPEQKEAFKSSSSIEIDRLYLPETLDESYMCKIGFPGEYPYTRGIQPTMYRARNWTMRQYAGFGSAETTNKRFRYLLQQGQTGLS